MTIVAVDRIAAARPADRSGQPATTRSSDVLEVLKILRTTATADAASQGSEQSEAPFRQLDIANVATALAIFEAEIKAILERARQEGDMIYQQALADVRSIDGEAPIRVKNAGTQTLDRRHDQPEIEQRTIMQRATADTERIQHDADAKISGILDTATALVWAAVTPGTALQIA